MKQGCDPFGVAPELVNFKTVDAGGRLTYLQLRPRSALHRSPLDTLRASGRLQRAAFHQFLQVGKIGFRLSLEHAHEERFRQLEESAYFPFER